MFIMTVIFYAVIRQISMLFIDNEDCVFCILSLKQWQGVPTRSSRLFL